MTEDLTRRMAELAAVLGGSELPDDWSSRFRRSQRRRRVALASAAVAAVAAVPVLLVGGPRGPVGDRPTPARSPDVAAPAPSAVDAPPTDPAPVVAPTPHGPRRFLDQRTLDAAVAGDGTVLVLGSTTYDDGSATTWVRRSPDGGRTVQRSSQVVVTTGTAEGPDYLTLGPARAAYAWGPYRVASDGKPAVWFTPDGRTWARARLTGVVQVAVEGDSVWFLRQTCTTGGQPSCTAQLLGGGADASPDEARDVLSLPRGTSGGQVTRTSPTRAYLVVDDGSLWRTTDGARSWSRLRLPPGCPGGIHTTLAAVGSTVWLDCQDEPTAVAEARLRRSDDGGRTWRALPTPPLFRYEVTLSLLSADHAFLTSGRATAFETVDGGRSWREVLPFEDTGYGAFVQTPSGGVVSALFQTDARPPRTSVLLVRPAGSLRWRRVLLGP